MPPTYSTTAPEEQVAPTAQLNTYALGLLQHFSFNATTNVLQYSLSNLLFGALTILVIASVSLLIGQGSLSRKSSRILLLSILMIYASTIIYMSAIIWSWTSVQRIIREANNGLYSDSYNGHDSLAALKAAAYRQSWMVTVPLGVNIVIGDAIVWWRAAVIWQNRVVYWVGPILVTMTLALGIIGSVTASPATPDQIFFWWGTDGFTNAAVILSCVTNTTATILIACKAWMHRLSLKKYFHAKTRVLKALALLVESGTIYCALLILVLVSLMDPASLANTLEYHTVGYYFVYGALTPMVAIYPTIIIVLVAVNRSPLERGILVDYPRGLPLTTTSTSTVVFGRGTMLPSPLVVAEEAHVVLGRAISRSDIDDGETLKGRSFEFERGDNKPFPSADSVLDIHS